jgi:hypothetical protein
MSAPLTGSRASPSARSVNSVYTRLFSVQFHHGYYNGSGGRCPDLKAWPTADCAALMASLGLIFRDHGGGFSVLADQAKLPALTRYVAGRYAAGPAGAGYWTWLSFLLISSNPNFINISSLPMSFNPLAQNLYFSNRQTILAGSAMAFAGTGVSGDAALYPVATTSLAAPTPTGMVASLADVAGAPVAAQSSADATATRFNLSSLPYGYYSVVLADALGAPAGMPTDFLHVPDAPQTIGMIDLFLTQPRAGVGDPADYPIAPLPVPPDPQAPAPEVTPVELSLPFAARETYWRYYIVSQGRPGQFTDDLAITGDAASFTRSDERLPNGDQAALFSAATTLTLQQRSPYRFKLSGQRQGADGSRDEISVDRLPAAPAGHVWPAPSGDALAGSSEIFVYV